MNARELLEAGLSEFEARPWLRGLDYDPDTGGVCAVGALRLAAMGGVWLDYFCVGPDMFQPYSEAEKFLHRTTRSNGVEIALYNDQTARSKEDVADKFKQAIKLAIEEESSQS